MIKKELLTFLVVGCLTVLIDYVTYRSLSALGLLGTHAAKGISFLTGTVFAYFANRFWTFGTQAHVAGSMVRFGFLYGVTVLVNVSVNALTLNVLSVLSYGMQAAFLVATGLSAMLNFMGMKYFVFAPTSRTTAP